MSKRPLLSGETKASAVSIQGCIQHPLNVLWMLYRRRRAPDYVLVSWMRTGKAWSFFGGVERKETYRKGKSHKYTSRGKQKTTGQCLIPTCIYSPLFQCMSVKFRSFKCDFLSSVFGECFLSSAAWARRGELTLSQPLNFPSRHGSSEKSCCCWQKGERHRGLSGGKDSTRLLGRETVPLSSSWGRAETGLVLC